MSAPSSWVRDRLGVRLVPQGPSLLSADELAGLAVRRNPRRSHLLVSTVLGKHVPTDPRIVYGSGLLLGLLVRDALSGNDSGHADRRALAALLQQGLADPDTGAAQDFLQAVRAAVGSLSGPAPLVLGYAETAVSLGHAVADALPGSDYLHSTRRRTDVPPVGGFEEEHSHATGHLLCPRDPALLTGRSGRPLVLVDDELTTGRTVLNTIAELHQLAARPRYVVATLLDMRTADDRAVMRAAAEQLGAPIEVVALAGGHTELPDGLAAAAAALVASVTGTGPVDASLADAPPLSAVGATTDTDPGAKVAELDVPDGGRHAITAVERERLARRIAGAAVRPAQPGERVLVLGCEEQMAAPLLLATSWAEAEPAAAVRFSTTTRSPAVAVDDPGYPLRTALTFDASPALTGDDGGPRFAYNVAPARGHQPWDRIVLVHDSGEPPAPSLLRALAGCTRRLEVLELRPPAELPPPLRGPEFGSYAADEVGWLLTDLSDVDLEAPTEHREREIQSGRAHYAESLPIEFQPDEAYTALFHAAVAESALRLARDVGLVAELIRTERSPRPVLVSLARAGVPVGILLRRWFDLVHGVQPEHYAVSIVRGRGIDALALRYLAARGEHDVVFVDGWTGKGAITRELTAAVSAHNDRYGTAFDPDMVVLADPGRCVRTFGTRDDFLIPSACLNSTVSGLISRTVLNDRLISPGDYHGAKFYAELADADVSNEFLDAVSSRFAEVADEVLRDAPALAAGDREPDWAGWAAVERISEEYGIGQVNLVKPGVGETTRVLLRRVPERVLVRPDARAELTHVLVLAEQRGVPVEEVADLPYSCVGLIRPQDGGEG